MIRLFGFSQLLKHPLFRHPLLRHTSAAEADETSSQLPNEQGERLMSGWTSLKLSSAWGNLIRTATKATQSVNTNLKITHQVRGMTSVNLMVQNNSVQENSHFEF